MQELVPRRGADRQDLGVRPRRCRQEAQPDLTALSSMQRTSTGFAWRSTTIGVARTSFAPASTCSAQNLDVDDELSPRQQPSRHLRSSRRCGPPAPFPLRAQSGYPLILDTCSRADPATTDGSAADTSKNIALDRKPLGIGLARAFELSAAVVSWLLHDGGGQQGDLSSAGLHAERRNGRAGISPARFSSRHARRPPRFRTDDLVLVGRQTPTSVWARRASTRDITKRRKISSCTCATRA